jgi:2'-5' RNA ligase
MAGNTQRLFIAIDTPPEVKVAMSELQKKLRATGADVRWEPQEKFHLTLKFLGDTETDRVERISATLRETIFSLHAVSVVYSGIGFFPPRGIPRVVWIGMSDDGESLDRLHATVEAQCLALGFPPEDRQFHPHVTLGRVRSREGIGALRRSVESLTFESHPIIISSIDLIRSTLKSDGSSYAMIARFPLQSGTTR